MNSAASLAPQNAAADFGRTRWSVVLAVRSGGEGEARRSLAELCRRYWVPVYAYVRRCGHAPRDAATLVQAFLSHLVQQIRDSDPAAEGGFRAFLQHRLEQFLASDWTRLETSPPLDDFAPPWPLEQIEQRQQREQLPQASAPQAFQRAFALELLALGLAQLREEAEHSGRGAMFDLVRPYLTREPVAGEYAQLAQAMQSSPLAAVIAVKRLRQRFQELIDAQLAQTVGSRQSFESERNALLTQLVPHGA
jgi:RNA polymerase sigma-70 factor (ECF subfamily)